MNESPPLYNSRLNKIYIQYLKKYYPDIDVDSILEEACIANYEIDDPAHWFTQEQQDRLQDILVARTDNPNIAREAGRFSTSSEGLGAAKQYALGLISPRTIYLLIEKMYALMSRGADVKAKTIHSNLVEITAVPRSGVKEKPYQCQNRTGTFESLARMFTDKFAQLEKLGYTVLTVSSGEEAVEYLLDHTIDLLVLDMILEPGIDGLETYQKIIEFRPGQKSIIASGYSESARVKEAQRLGAGTYLKKPYLLQKIGWTIKTELNK